MFDLRDLKALVLRRRRWLAVPALGGLAAGAALGLSATPNFVATSQVLIDPRGLQVIEGSLNPGNGQVSDASLVVVESQAGVIVSQGVLTKVVQEQNLTADPDFTERRSFIAPIGDAVRTALGITRTGDAPALVAYRELQKKTAVKRGEKSYVVDIAVETDDRFKSARIANAVADVYLRGELQSRTEASQKASEGLTARLDELRGRVRTAEDKAEAYKAEKKLVGANGRLVSDQQLSDLNTQLGIALTKASEARTRYEQIRKVQSEGLQPDAIAESLQSGLITQLRTQYAEVRRRQAEVTAHLGARHPDIVQMDAQIRSQGALIAQELARIVRSAQLDYERARNEAASLTAALEKLKSRASDTSREFVRLRELEREVETSRRIYEAFSKRAREIGEQQAIDTSTTRKISEAVPPSKAKGLGLLEYLLAGTLGGLFLGGAGGVLRDQLSRSVQSQRQVGEVVDLPILASVPGKPRRRSKAAPKDTFAARFGAPDLDGAATMALYNLDHRILGARKRRPLSVLVTAPATRDGLSAATLAWALVAARDRRRVLVIDARGPSARASKARKGLTDVMSAGSSLEAAVQRDGTLPLSWLEYGSGRQAGLPSVSVLKQAVLAQAEAYDLVLVEVGNLRTDPSIANWAEATDAIVLAVEEDATDLRDVTASAEALSVLGEKVSGLLYVGRG